MSETDHQWAIRIDARGDSYPNYVGPLHYSDAEELARRLRADRRSFEMALCSLRWNCRGCGYQPGIPSLTKGHHDES